jgi:hypothetical protein
MIKINGFKGIWTLSEVEDLLKDAKVDYKLITESTFRIGHEIEKPTEAEIIIQMEKQLSQETDS